MARRDTSVPAALTVRQEAARQARYDAGEASLAKATVPMRPLAIAAPGYSIAGRSGGGVLITIDMTDMQRLAVGFFGVADGIRRGRSVISMSINHGLRKMRTWIKPELERWTGLREVSRIHEAISIVPSSPATLTGILRVDSDHVAVTRAYFGAQWSRGTAGASHAAWNRGQMAKGAFMAPGKAPVFKRTSSERLPIVRVWGPNLAREVERHEAIVQSKVNAAGYVVAREAARLMSAAVSGASVGSRR